MKQINLKENPTNLPPIFMEVLIWVGPEKPFIGWMTERKESILGVSCKFGYVNPALMNDKDSGYREIDSSAIVAWCRLPKLKK